MIVSNRTLQTLKMVVTWGLWSIGMKNPGSLSDLVQSTQNTAAEPHSGGMEPPMFVHKPVAHRA